jgi:dihydrolipoamide dehydrogenase
VEGLCGEGVIFDVDKKICIIGGGPGGYTCAIRLAQLGAHVTLIEKDTLGGTCLNRGCIPTKALLKSAEVMNTFKTAKEFGIIPQGFSLDFTKVMERKNNIVKKLHTGILLLMKKYQIKIIYGTASFVDPNTVAISHPGAPPSFIHADFFVIATGSVPFIPPIPGVDSIGIHTSDSILHLDTLPQTTTIIGGGIIGMEFASILNAFGTKVRVIESMPSILGKIDPDISKRVLPLFKKQGIQIQTNTRVDQIKKTQTGYWLHGSDGSFESEFESESLLISTGRKAYCHGLGLENIGIELSDGFLWVNNQYQTKVENIYAIGDVTGGWMLAHTATHMGLICAQSILDDTPQGNLESIVPSCIFTFPEIAYVGLSEEDAKTQGISYKTAKIMFGANGKALCIGEGEGFVKVIAKEDTHQVLGVHIMGPHASDLIHEAVLILQKGLRTKDLWDVIHAHPTLSETFLESLMKIDERAIHT